MKIIEATKILLIDTVQRSLSRETCSAQHCHCVWELSLGQARLDRVDGGDADRTGYRAPRRQQLAEWRASNQTRLSRFIYGGQTQSVGSAAPSTADVDSSFGRSVWKPRLISTAGQVHSTVRRLFWSHAEGLAQRFRREPDVLSRVPDV